MLLEGEGCPQYCAAGETDLNWFGVGLVLDPPLELCAALAGCVGSAEREELLAGLDKWAQRPHASVPAAV